MLTARRPTDALASHLGARAIARLGLFCHQTKAGHLFGSNTVYRCFGNSRTGRKDDVSFIRKGRLPGARIPEGAIDIPADLIIEVVSPTDNAYDVETKAKLYLGNDFPELWVIFPNTRTVHVRRSGEPEVLLDTRATLKGRGALTGFECAVRNLFPA